MDFVRSNKKNSVSLGGCLIEYDQRVIVGGLCKKAAKTIQNMIIFKAFFKGFFCQKSPKKVYLQLIWMFVFCYLSMVGYQIIIIRYGGIERNCFLTIKRIEDIAMKMISAIESGLCENGVCVERGDLINKSSKNEFFKKLGELSRALSQVGNAAQKRLANFGKDVQANVVAKRDVNGLYLLTRNVASRVLSFCIDNKGDLWKKSIVDKLKRTNNGLLCCVDVLNVYLKGVDSVSAFLQEHLESVLGMKLADLKSITAKRLCAVMQSIKDCTSRLQNEINVAEEPMGLQEVVDEAVRSAGKLVGAHNIAFNCTFESDKNATIHNASGCLCVLKRVLINLVRTHNDAESEIRIKASIEHERVMINVIGQHDVSQDFIELVNFYGNNRGVVATVFPSDNHRKNVICIREESTIN